MISPEQCFNGSIAAVEAVDYSTGLVQISTEYNIPHRLEVPRLL